ncbi:MAG: hypothetical protein LN568_00820 [Rickettsia endosymbiont of Pseudomimeciton antennatum]|nr:hypothetical protein [Rickettsia endosymbiont of Pseudomimeciton antennatum]
MENNDIKNEEIIDVEETSCLYSLPKEHECSISTPKSCLALAMSLIEEEVKVSGVSDNDNTDV